jgi:glutaredoxin
VTYSDTPPPPSATLVEKKSGTSGASTDVNLPYELAQAVKGNPVVLYTTANCAACDDARKLLNARGIPFSEKTVISNDDLAQLKRAGGDAQLPFLTAGRNKQQGFEPNAWNNLLTAAGYPETSKLPKNYRNPQVESAAPKPTTVTRKEEKSRENDKSAAKLGSATPPAPTGNAPPGFRF